MKDPVDSNVDGPGASASAKRSRLLGKLLRQHLDGEPGANPGDFECPPEQEELLSFSQQRLWFLDRLEGRPNPLYNVPFSFHLEGPVNREALRRAIGLLVERHEALRMVFREVAGEPRVELLEPYDPLTLLDLSDQPPANAEQRGRELLEKDALIPFDLARGPLFRMTLVTLGERRYLLLGNIHHIISDGWSLAVLLRELGIAYNAFCANSEPKLQPLPVRYRTYSHWQRQHMQGDLRQRELAFWRSYLFGAPGRLRLPTDREHPARNMNEGGRVNLTLTRELTAELRRLALTRECTLFMVLFSAFNLLLYRCTRQPDIPVGITVANRLSQEVEGVIGLFVNTLVLRSRIEPEKSFTEFLAETRNASIAAFDHQELPFEYLVEQLRPERSRSHSPLFQVMFNMRNMEAAKLELSGLRVSERQRVGIVSKFNLHCDVQENEDRLNLSFVYNRALFDEPRVTGWLEQYERLLQQIVIDPEQSVGVLSSETEQAQQPQHFSIPHTPDTDYPRECAIHQRFEQQAERRPEAVALKRNEQVVCYGDLNERAERLARHLRARGVSDGEPVGLFLERSIEQVIALLGILKSGGAYLPLDPAYPEERLRFMVQDAGVRVVLAHSGEALFLAQTGIEVLPVEPAAELPLENEETSNSVVAGGETAAYVMYTSGSTGTPKGVVIPHRAVMRLVVNTDYVQLGEGDRVAQVSNSSFDAATFEIWGALLNGATLVIIEGETLLSPPDLAVELKRHRITTLFLTTALFNLIAYTFPQAFRSLRDLLFGGEQVDPEAVRRVLSGGAPQRLLHMYGPTENTTFTTWHLVTKVPAAGGTVPIGRPVANSSVHLLDDQGQSVAMGVTGEIYIGGDGLACGYLNRPELTDERFREIPGLGRVYRTGDLAELRPDGSLQFIGRRDRQIKIRGFRIEPDEIEVVLRLHPKVRDAAVVEQGDAEGRHLAAYLVSEGEPEDDWEQEVRRYLSLRLPGYMMPGSFTLLKKLPLTPNGKLDVAALPHPVRRSKKRSEPATAIERKLVDVWQELLPDASVASESHFFELGGNSLLLVRLAVRIQVVFGKELEVATLFEHPLLSDQARLLERRLTESLDAVFSPPESEETSTTTRVNPFREATCRQPQNLVEQRLVEIWKELLWRVDEIGVDEDFFDLGGYSLLMVKLVARIEEEFAVTIPVSDLFRFRTIAGIASLLAEDERAPGGGQAVEQPSPTLAPELLQQLFAFTQGWEGERAESNSLLVQLNPEGMRPGLFWCSHGFNALQELHRSLRGGRAICGMWSAYLMRGFSDRDLDELASWYADEIIAIQSTGEYCLGAYCSGAELMGEVARQLQKRGKTVANLIAVEGFGPLVRRNRVFGFPVTLVFGRDSDANPFKTFSQPERMFERFFPAGYRVRVVPGEHLNILQSPYVSRVSEIIDELLEEESIGVAGASLPASVTGPIVPEEGCKGKISLVAKRKLLPDWDRIGANRKIMLCMTIRNCSPDSWLATSLSGITLCGWWLDVLGRKILMSCGDGTLTKEVAPGEAAKVSITIQTPPDPGDYVLKFDLVQQGIGRFAKQGSLPWLTPCRVIEDGGSDAHELQATFGDRDMLARAGNEKFMRGDYIGCVPQFERALRQGAPDAELLKQLGMALSRLERYQRSVDVLRQAAVLAPEDGELWFELGRATLAAGDANEAIAFLGRASLPDERAGEIELLTGQACLQSGALQQAASDFRSVIELRPEWSNGYAGLAEACYRSGDVEQAIDNYRLAIRWEQGKVEYYLALARLFRERHDLDQALTLIDIAHELEPESYQVHLAYAAGHRQKGDLEQAEMSLRRAHELCPVSYTIHRSLVDLLLERENETEAMELLQQALVQWEDRIDFHLRMAKLQERRGLLGEALRILLRAHELEPENPQVLTRLGMTYIRKGEHELAKNYFAKAMQQQTRRQSDDSRESGKE